MKIFCVGRNYSEHIKELGNESPEAPVIFLKPDTALLRKGTAFYLPDFSKEIHYECELVIKINRNGKNIAKEFASKYYDEITVGIDFTARDLQKKLKSKGLPWELSKAFDGSAVVGEFIPAQHNENINFSLSLNGRKVQESTPSKMIYTVDYLISFISSYFTLKKGDLIFTGTPQGVGTVLVGDRLEGFINEKKLLSLTIR